MRGLTNEADDPLGNHVPAFVYPLAILAFPGLLAWLGSRQRICGVLVPRGAPPRWLTVVVAVGLVASAALIVSLIPDSSDDAWLILGPAIYALGLGAIALLISSILPGRHRTRFTSAVIFAVVMLCALNAVLLLSWALGAERDLDGNAIRPPLVRAIGVLATVALLLLIVGQGRARIRRHP